MFFIRLHPSFAESKSISTIGANGNIDAVEEESVVGSTLLPCAFGCGINDDRWDAARLFSVPRQEC